MKKRSILPKGEIPQELQQIARLSKLMDSSIAIPIINKRIGLEPIIGLIPVAGDVVGFAISTWIMTVLIRNNGSGKVMAKMSLNILVDLILSFVPILGNILDFFVKTNQKNLNLALEHYQYGKNQGSAWSVIVPFVAALSIAFLVMISFSAYLFYLLFQFLLN